MCLAIPGQVCELTQGEPTAVVDVMGVRRKISTQMLVDDSLDVGEWVLIHVGFAMSKISDEHAREQIKILEAMGEAADAEEEARGYAFGHPETDQAGGATP